MLFGVSIYYNKNYLRNEEINVYAIIGFIIGLALCFFVSKKINNKIMLEKNEKLQKFVGYFELMNIWLELMESNKSVSSYFMSNGYKKIGIYGAGKLGAHLYEQIKNCDIELAYFIDRNIIPFGNNIKVLSMDDDFEDVDVIVVTPVFDYINIRKKLKDKCEYKIVSVEDVLYETYEEF